MPASPKDGAPVVGVNVAGYFDALVGLGEMARQVRGALETSGVPVSTRTLDHSAAPRLDQASAAREPPDHPLNLVCVNADGMEGALAELGLDWFKDRYTIGLWWWKTESFPDRWWRAFDVLDEVWAGSGFVADSVAAVSPVPVVRIPAPVAPATPSGVPLGELPEGPVFLHAFDYSSVFERKNPLGVVGAFRSAFPDGEEVGLLVKSVGAAGAPDAQQRLLEAAAGDPRIVVIDRVLDPGEMAGLLERCDAYISLHRSEGFGIAIAEAMLLGRPVIATDYGGPRDYLSIRNSYPVGYSLERIGPGNEPYPEGGVWAQPNLAEASRFMREVVDDPEGALARGSAAREDIARRYSPQAAGAAMAARLARIAGLAPREGRLFGSGRGLAERIRSEPPGQPPGALAFVRRPLRRSVLRLIRPQVVHQRDVDEEIERTLRELDERFGGLAASQATLLAELRAVRDRVTELERSKAR
jgi:hypothetical protein